MGPLEIASILLAVLVGISLFLYLRPKYFTKLEGLEGFAVIALDGETMPRCFTRSPEAQNLLKTLYPMKQVAPASKEAMAYDELKLILEKILCIDADVTGLGAGPYQTYQLPFATQHDIEPPASFVGRCLKGAVKPRDIEVEFMKFNDRGQVLIDTLSYDDQQRPQLKAQFRNIVVKAAHNIAFIALSDKANLDRPKGARDPGYYVPHFELEQGPYEIKGQFQYF
jgi:hypothetical protein